VKFTDWIRSRITRDVFPRVSVIGSKNGHTVFIARCAAGLLRSHPVGVVIVFGEQYRIFEDRPLKLSRTA